MTFRALTRTRVALVALASLAVAGCTTNPATGERSFTALLSPEQELRIGAEQHPKIISQFGGTYDNPEVAAYVDELGQRLAAVSELPDLDFTFTVLDSDVVNAFALPGGYIYISRGLIALANSEAELAGVLGHEIGHVTARHAAQRYSQAGLAQGATVLAAVLFGRGGAELAQGVSGVAIQSYSRGQEFQSDQLGVRYLSRTGYDTAAMASFLSQLQAQSQLEAELTGAPDPASRFNIMSTHPRTADRVREATAAAGVTPVANPRVGVDEFLDVIDGLDYRGSRKSGFIIDRDFIHTEIGFQFTVPPGFRLANNPSQVIARDTSGGAIVFDAADGSAGTSMADFVRQWVDSIALPDLETIDVNGMEAATGSARITRNNRPFIARPLAIRFDEQRVFRFLFLIPADQEQALSEPLRRTTFSFRKLSAAERRDLRPLRITVRDAAGQSAAELSQQMAIAQSPERWFDVLNGLDGQPPSGRVKLITR